MSFKNLSPDGGGFRDLLQARKAQDISVDVQSQEVLKRFYRVIGNSVSCILYACHCNDIGISEIISLVCSKEKSKSFGRPKANE